jgi:hypothetical protein
VSALRGVALAALLSASATACRDGDHDHRGGDEAARALFDAKRVVPIALRLEPSAMTELAREPRDWVRGSLQIGGASEPLYDDVAIRFKGHRSLRTWAEKPAFKLDFVKHDKDRRILGLRGLVLNSMVEDPTMLRENLGARIFAALGVPAPRAGYGELFVNGERFGLYALIEPIDRSFLGRHFEDDGGPVYEGEYGCDLYEGDVWAFQADSDEDERRAHLFALARAAKGPPASWLLGSRPLVDRSFLAYLAGSALVGDFDGYRHSHNYRIYRDAGSGRWSFIPWGLDRILKQRLSVFDSNGRLARACFADRACRLEYVKAAQRAARRFESLALEHTVDRLQALIAPAIQRDRRRPYNRDKQAKAIASLRAFIRERPAEMHAEVACWDGARELDRDGDGAGCMDCDDGDPTIHPGALEQCDGKDNDCSGLVDDAPSCECPAAVAGGASFSLCPLPMSWEQAEQFCAARGQVLARLDSREMAKELHAAASAVRKTSWWVGLDDREREGAFHWQDGSRAKRSLWSKGEPDNYACGQHCAALTKNGRGKLRDMHCATLSPFACGPIATPKE